MNVLLGFVSRDTAPALPGALRTRYGVTVAMAGTGSMTNRRIVRAMLIAKGYAFEADGDAETLALLVHDHVKKGASLFRAVRHAAAMLTGAWAAAVMNAAEPDCIVATAQGEPLLIGVGQDHRAIGGDAAALAPYARRCVVLEAGDVAEVRCDDLVIVNRTGQAVLRTLQKVDALASGMPVAAAASAAARNPSVAAPSNG